MTELKNVIKYLDIVLDKVDGTNSFNLSSIISENCSVNEKDNNELAIFLKLCDSVEMLGTTYKYFEKIEYANELFSDFKLSESGIKAKEIGGHLKYQKSLKPKIPLLKILSIILAGFLVLFAYLNYNLKVNQYDLTKKLGKTTKNLDSLKVENVHLKLEKFQLLKLVDSLTN